MRNYFIWFHLLFRVKSTLCLVITITASSLDLKQSGDG